MTDAKSKAAVAWLASVAPDLRACLAQWEDNPYATVLLPAGVRQDVLLVPGRVGYSVFDTLVRQVRTPAPVLADIGGTRTCFFVPPGTAAFRLRGGSRVAGFGTWIAVSRPDRAVDGMRWLVPPDASGTLNEPAVVEEVLHESVTRCAGYGAARP